MLYHIALIAIYLYHVYHIPIIIYGSCIFFKELCHYAERF